MFRRLLVVALLMSFSVSIGCSKKEIKAERTAFTKDDASAKKGMDQARNRMSQYMKRPEMKGQGGTTP